MDLRDLFDPVDPLTPKRALLLVAELPPSSHTSALLRDSEDSYGWDTHAYLLASTANAIREGTFVNMQVRTKKQLERPEPIRIPGTESGAKKKPKANHFVRMAQQQLALQQRRE